MPNRPAKNARQLALLRWPLLAVVVASGCAVANASWTRIGRSKAAQTTVVRTEATEQPSASPAAPAKLKQPAAIEKSSLASKPAASRKAVEQPIVETQDDRPQTEVSDREQAIQETFAAAPLTSEVTEEKTATPARGLVLANSAQSALRVGFAIGNEIGFLAPGESRQWSGDGPWEIAFHRGADFGDEKQTLSAGRYDFSVSWDGWRLEPSDPSAP